MALDLECVCQKKRSGKSIIPLMMHAGAKVPNSRIVRAHMVSLVHT